MDTPLLILTNTPNRESAQQLATQALERRLAACANILGPVESLYHWEGKIEQTTEIPLLLKTTARCYPALEALLQHTHPYQVPEIIALPITQGLPAYLAWLAAETTPSHPPSDQPG